MLLRLTTLNQHLDITAIQATSHHSHPFAVAPGKRLEISDATNFAEKEGPHQYSR